MFGSLGGPELIFLAVLALILFGPRRLPGLGRSFGKTVAEFRKASQEFRHNLEREVGLEEIKETGDALKNAARDARSVLDEVDPRRPAPPRPNPPRSEVKPPDDGTGLET